MYMNIRIPDLISANATQEKNCCIRYDSEMYAMYNHLKQPFFFSVEL